MASARPPGGTPTARLELDLSAFRAAPAVARESARAAAREISNAFKTVQNEQKIALAQAQQTFALIRGQQQQLTAAVKAESAVRIAQGKAEAAATTAAARAAATQQQQIARVAAQAQMQQATAQSVAQQQAAKIATTQAQQALAMTRAQQAQIVSATNTAAQAQQQAARATAQLQIQQGRVAAQAQVQQSNVVAQTQIANARAAAQIQVQQARVAAQAQMQANRAAAQRSGGFAGGVAGAVLGSIGGPIGAIAGAAAGGGGPAAVATAVGVGVVQMGKAAVESEKLATSYGRQLFAATKLAGGQSNLNALLATYQKVTGGAINEATALADVTSLVTQGFAKNTKDLETFLRGVRGASVATGKGQDFIIERAQFEMLNQTGQRLNEIGLSMEEVRKRAEQLRGTNKSLTKEQAYSAAVLDSLNTKFGSLSDSAVAQATGVERLSKSWADLQLQFGKTVKGPIDSIAAMGAAILNEAIKEQQAADAWNARAKRVNQQMRDDAGVTDIMARSIGVDPTVFKAQRLTTMPQPELLPSAANGVRPTPRAAPGFSADQTAVMVNRQKAISQLNRGTSQGIDDVMTEGASQRRQAIANYEKQSVREAEDFARQRLNNERKYNLSILDLHQDSARQRVKWEQDLNRNLEQARADSAEKVAELRADSSERVAEIEANFDKDREKRAKRSAETLRDAAAAMNAVAVREEQRRVRLENKEQEEARDEAVAKEGTSLDKRIAQEETALAKQEAQQREAHELRLAEQKENDRLRLEDMKAAFEAQKTQEDEERTIQLGRQKDDHEAQLTEMETQQATRIQQIKDHAKAERDQIDKDYNEALAAVGIFTASYVKEHERVINEAILGHMRYVNALNDSWKQSYPGHASQADPYANDPDYLNKLPPSVTPISPLPSGFTQGVTSPRSVTNNVELTVTIQAPASFAPNEESKDWLYGVLDEFFEDYQQ